MKPETMTFKSKYPIRTKIVVYNHILEQTRNFNYLIPDSFDIHRDNKLSKFSGICGTIHHRDLKNKNRKDIHMKFYRWVAIPAVLYGSEIWTLSKREEKKIQAAGMKFEINKKYPRIFPPRSGKKLDKNYKLTLYITESKHLDLMTHNSLPVAAFEIWSPWKEKCW